jgi:CRP/FNR family transcriptional regulator, anaerobic regulatory protein
MDENIVGIIEVSSTPYVRKALEPDEFLVRQEDPLESIYVIVSGLVKLYRSESGGREMLVGLLGANELLGEIEFFLGDPLFCHIRAVHRTELLVIDHTGFRRLLDECPEFRERLFKTMSARLRDLSLRTSGSFTRSTEDSLSVLIRENDRRGISFTRRMYADYLGVSERSVNRAIRRLEEKGGLRREGGRILLPDGNPPDGRESPE